MLTMPGVGEGDLPLAPIYAAAFARELGYKHTFGHSYEPPGTPRPVKGRRYVPAIMGFPVNVKVYTWHQMFDLYLDSEPMFGTPMIHCHMEGEPWGDDDLFGLCQVVKELPYGLQAGQVLIDEASWLDENPEFRGIPGVMRAHDDKRKDREMMGAPQGQSHALEPQATPYVLREVQDRSQDVQAVSRRPDQDRLEEGGEED